jgi:hypothetical protein
VCPSSSDRAAILGAALREPNEHHECAVWLAMDEAAIDFPMGIVDLIRLAPGIDGAAFSLIEAAGKPAGRLVSPPGLDVRQARLRNMRDFSGVGV